MPDTTDKNEMRAVGADVLLFLRLARAKMREDNNSTKSREELFDWLVEQATGWGEGRPILSLVSPDGE